MVAKATPSVSVSSGCLPKLRLLCLDWFKEISVQDLCYSWKIRTGKEPATEFALGPPADISSLFDPERECRISKKPGLPVSSDWRRFFGGAYGLVSPPSPPSIPVPVMVSAAQTNGWIHLSAQPCSAKGMLPSWWLLCLGISRRRRGWEEEKT